MPAEVFAIVTASEAVGSETGHPAREPWGELVGDDLHEVGGRDDRRLRILQRFQDVWSLRRFRGVQPVPTFHFERVAAELVVAGDAPHIGADLIFFREDLLSAKSF